MGLSDPSGTFKERLVGVALGLIAALNVQDLFIPAVPDHGRVNYAALVPSMRTAVLVTTGLAVVAALALAATTPSEAASRERLSLKTVLLGQPL